MMFLVYVYYSADWKPYYVGKGNKRRPSHPHSKVKVTRADAEHTQLFYFAEEWEAFECEQQLINFWGRQCDGGCLLNQSLGGPGTPGHKHKPETIEKMRRTHKGKVISQEQRQKTSRALKGRPLSEETKRKMSASRLGKKRGPYKKKKGAACL